MAQLNIKKQLQTILKEGYLEKQSRFLKNWRKRWFVLTNHGILTFKERKVYDSPTETIILTDISSIKSCDDETHKQFSFRIDTNDISFYIAASSNSEKQQWIGQIGKAMVKNSNKS